MTPDGTILESKHRHDHVSHTDSNSEYYSNDGGLDYFHRTVNEIPAKDLSLYDNASHEQIRKVITRGSRGKSGREKLRYILLKDIDDEYLQAIIDYEQELRPNNRFLPIYLAEKEFRKNL